MDKKMKNIVNRLIKREYENLDFKSGLDKNKELKKEYEKYCNEIDNISSKLMELLPEEHHHLIEEFESANSVITSVEAAISFKEGITLGVTELNFLNELGIEIAFI